MRISWLPFNGFEMVTDHNHHFETSATAGRLIAFTMTLRAPVLRPNWTLRHDITRRRDLPLCRPWGYYRSIIKHSCRAFRQWVSCVSQLISRLDQVPGYVLQLLRERRIRINK